VSKILDALRQAEAENLNRALPFEADRWQNDRRFRMVCVSSNKGGVGKTTVATNLAVYLRALREEQRVLLFAFDDQTTLDRMFDLGAEDSPGDIADGIREGSFARVARLGQYGVDYIPSSRDIPGLKRLLESPHQLQRILLASDPAGTVVVDTKSDFENLTQSAIQSSDLTIVVVKDQASLHEAQRVFDLLAKQKRPLESARVLLSLVDLRVKFREDEEIDVLGHLVSQIRREGYPLFQTFISRSPKVESLYTNPEGRAHAILGAANQSAVHRQMHQLTQEVLTALEGLPPSRTQLVPDSTATPLCAKTRPNVYAALL
jgi:cellulose biosynthesis protein BcsQ